jgi:hypothetical protein
MTLLFIEMTSVMALNQDEKGEKQNAIKSE